MKLVRLTVFSAIVALFAVPSWAQLNVVWPRDGSTVRESVNVAVDASNLPSDAYVMFSLNGSFVSSSGVPNPISGGRQAYTWVWDTRQPIALQANAEPARLEDGPYEISIVAVQGDTVLGRATINVQLANRVSGSITRRPLTLRYRLQDGQRKRYQVRIGVTLAEVGGAPVSSTQEIQVVSYTGLASVEDRRDDGLFLMRFRPSDTSLRLFGQSVGRFPAFESGSFYGVMNSHGRIVATDIFSTVGIKTSPAFGLDYMLALPQSPVQVGATWPGTIGMSLPGVGDAVNADASFTLDSLEWAGGRECARINSTFNGQTQVRLMLGDQNLEQAIQGKDAEGNLTGPSMIAPPSLGGPMPGGTALGPMGGTGEQTATGRVTGTSSDWFAFGSGELIRRELTAVIETRLDSSAIERINQALGLGATAQQTAMDRPTRGRGAVPGSPMDGPGAEEEALIDEYKRRRDELVGTSSGPFGGRQQAAVQTPQGVRAKLRVQISARLIN